jgi:7-carboxy-7-deazaguanine synthase
MTETTRLRITEIFYSLQGESARVGLPTVFVRLTGCPLRCEYCDTAYAFSGGEWLDIDSIVQQVAAYQSLYVCVTGGEPLAQKGAPELLQALCDAGYRVSLETSGAMDIGGIDARVTRVVDLKTPGSGELDRNLYQNIDLLTEQDEVKFVITDRRDYDWACSQLDRYRLNERCGVLFSPVHGELEPVQLAEWILEDRLPVRFQIQLHKYLWGNQSGK